MDEIVELTTRLATALSRLEVVAEQAAAAPSEVDIDAMNVLSVARDATLAEREAEVQKLRAVNQALLDSNADLRMALDASDGEEAAVVASLIADFHADL